MVTASLQPNQEQAVMFYSRLKLRNVAEPISPKGPSFRWARSKRIDIDGSHIQLKVPGHRGAPYDQRVDPKSGYTLENVDLYMERYRSDRTGWSFLTLMNRAWLFYGPCFTGEQGAVRLHVSLLTPSQRADNISFFHPRAFESSVADFLSYLYDDRFLTSLDNEQQWFAPVGWRPHNRIPCPAAIFDAIPNRKVNETDIERYLVFPIENRFLVEVNLSLTRSRVWLEGNQCPEPDTDNWIDPNPFNSFANQILDSIQVTLSPAAQAQRRKALEGFDEACVIEEFPPLKWKNENISSTGFSGNASPQFKISH